MKEQFREWNPTTNINIKYKHLDLDRYNEVVQQEKDEIQKLREFGKTLKNGVTDEPEEDE